MNVQFIYHVKTLLTLELPYLYLDLLKTMTTRWHDVHLLIKARLTVPGRPTFMHRLPYSARLARHRCIFSCLVYVKRVRFHARLQPDSFVNHGGIICLERNGLRMTKVNLPYMPVSFEVLCVRLHSGNSTSTSILSIIYRPGSKPSNVKFFLEFSEHLESLATYSCPIYLTGDFNIHVNDLSDKFTIELEGLFETFRLLQRVKNSTHGLGGTLDLLGSRHNRAQHN